MPLLTDWLLLAKQHLTAQDARLLAQHVLGLTTEELLCASPTQSLTDAQLAQLNKLQALRQNHCPMAYILGGREFFGQRFAVNAHTLIPRPDSECLIERALALPIPQTILDLGTGSGCLIISLLMQWPQARGVAVDISPEALDVASLNAKNLGVADRLNFMLGDWAAGIEGSFDLIISNPPYITTQAMNELTPDVAQFEPHTALHGGDDGLGAYRQIIPQAKKLLAPQGHILFEIGYDQGQSVPLLAQAHGFNTAVFKDLSGHDRVVQLSLA